MNRRGSILITSLSMTTIFLTMILATMAYVQASKNRATTDRWRLVADQAARTGMAFVLGYGEAGIDKETKLPRTWDSLSDGNVIDPVLLGLNKTAADTNNPFAARIFDVMGTNINEMVIGRQNATDAAGALTGGSGYVVSFKARIQQYRISVNMPKQYRIGVVGRVRKITGNFNLSTDETRSIVAERVLVAQVGKEPVSRYAALIDIDAVQNWIPGEIITGPVHINRGYVDADEYAKNPAVAVGSVTVVNPPDLGPNTSLTSAVGGNASHGSRSSIFMRSQMRLFAVDNRGTNPGFAGAAGAVPQFMDRVSITEIPGGSDFSDGQGEGPYPVADPAAGSASSAVYINNLKYHTSVVEGTSVSTNVGKRLTLDYGDAIFRSRDNQNETRWGSKPGPVIEPLPIVLPRNVRNRLNQSIGAPVSVTGFAGKENKPPTDNWNTLEDGIYIPTKRFFDGNGNGTYLEAGDVGTAYQAQAGNHATGGIYVRGNIQVLRMNVYGDKSVYVFQLGANPHLPAGLPAPVNPLTPFRTFSVCVDRTTKEIVLKKHALGQTFASLTNSNGIATFDTGSGEVSAGAFAVDNGPAVTARLAGNPDNLFPFNGVIFVDLARRDPVRLFGVPNGANPPPNQLNETPLTGNIFALGDPRPFASKTAWGLANNADRPKAESVATYVGTTPAGAASKLNIMASGNIWIQNDLVLDAIRLVRPSVTNPDNPSRLDTANTQDLVGLVTDKQVVIGLSAPSANARANLGCLVHASIAALGDPGLEYGISTGGLAGATQAAEKLQPNAFRGSVATEGMMYQYNVSEDYKTNFNNAACGAGGVAYPDPINQGSAAAKAAYTTWYDDGPGNSAALGYPGNPIYGGPTAIWGTPPAGTSWNPNVLNPITQNPNRAGTRGRLQFFGSVTQKKRGIVGLGNFSYDKDFRFDRRLLSIAPPIFPSSTNVLTRTQSPFAPEPGVVTRRLYYRIGGAINLAGGAGGGNVNDDLHFIAE